MLVLCMLPPPPPSSLSSLSAVSSSSSEEVPMAASVADPDCPSSSSVSPISPARRYCWKLLDDGGCLHAVAAGVEAAEDSFAVTAADAFSLPFLLAPPSASSSSDATTTAELFGLRPLLFFTLAVAAGDFGCCCSSGAGLCTSVSCSSKSASIDVLLLLSDSVATAAVFPPDLADCFPAEPLMLPPSSAPPPLSSVSLAAAFCFFLVNSTAFLLFTPAGDFAGDDEAPAEDALTGVFAAGVSSPRAFFVPTSHSELGARCRFRPFPLLPAG